MKLRYLLVGFLLGLLVAWWWHMEDALNKTPAAPAPSKVDTRMPAHSQAKDALSEIDGIGPAYERALNSIGIFTFVQLAAQDADSLAQKLPTRVNAERIRRELWIEQAKTRTK